MNRLTPAKLIAKKKNVPDGGAATPVATEDVQPTTYRQGIVMTDSTRPEPVLPLEFEAGLTVRQIRMIASALAVHQDKFVRADARALKALADALERSLGGAA